MERILSLEFCQGSEHTFQTFIKIQHTFCFFEWKGYISASTDQHKTYVTTAQHKFQNEVYSLKNMLLNWLSQSFFTSSFISIRLAFF